MILKKIFQLLFLAWCFCSCKGQQMQEVTCTQKFKQARDIALLNPDRPSALDSALSLTNDIMQCDSIRKAVVDFKISLLVSRAKYPQALSFIDSLSNSDFAFNYKKNLTYKSIQALSYESNENRIKRDSVYKVINDELEAYIKERNPTGKEFKQIYTELFATKQKYLDKNKINSEVDILAKKYTEYQSFFEVFRVDSTSQQ